MKIIIDGLKNFIAQVIPEKVRILGIGEKNVGSIGIRGLWGHKGNVFRDRYVALGDVKIIIDWLKNFIAQTLWENIEILARVEKNWR